MDAGSARKNISGRSSTRTARRRERRGRCAVRTASWRRNSTNAVCP